MAEVVRNHGRADGCGFAASRPLRCAGRRATLAQAAPRMTAPHSAAFVPATRSLFGFHAVTARLRQRPEAVHALYVLAGRQDPRVRDLVARAEASQVAIHPVDHARLDALAGHGRHQGVVAIVDDALPHVTLDDVLDSPTEPPLLLILDGVTDPHNLGACLRSADAFGALAVMVPKDRAVGVNATVAKAASGAADTVPVIAVTNLARTMRELKERGVWLLGADAGGRAAARGRPVRTASRGCWAPRAPACAGSRASRATASSASRWRERGEPQRVGGGRDLPLRHAGRPGALRSSRKPLRPRPRWESRRGPGRQRICA